MAFLATCKFLRVSECGSELTPRHKIFLNLSLFGTSRVHVHAHRNLTSLPLGVTFSEYAVKLFVCIRIDAVYFMVAMAIWRYGDPLDDCVKRVLMLKFPVACFIHWRSSQRYLCVTLTTPAITSLNVLSSVSILHDIHNGGRGRCVYRDLPACSVHQNERSRLFA